MTKLKSGVSHDVPSVDIASIRNEIRQEYQDKIDKLKMDYKLKESNFANRMLDKMHEYESKLEGIVQDKEQEITYLPKAYRVCSPVRKTKDWKDTCRKYTDRGWKSELKTDRIGNYCK